MGRQIGRSSALILAVGVLALVGLVLWVGDAATGGKGRRALISRLLPEEKGNRPRRSWVLGAGEKAGKGKTSSREKTKTPPKASPLKIVDPNSSCTIAGVVFDEDHHPVRDCRITVRGARQFNRSVQTDAKGHFAVSGIPTGTFDINATHKDYVALVRPAFSLTEQGQIARIEFILPLGATVKGVVQDEAGVPLEGVRVAARRQKLEALLEGEVYLDDTLYKTLKTDKKGEFSVAGVSLGGNVLECRKAGYQMEVKELSVKATKDQPKVTVVLRKTGTLAGFLVDEGGRPVTSATVHLVRYKPVSGPAEKIEKGKSTATSDGQGQFRFSKLFTEGFYDLLIDDPRFAPKTLPLVPVGSAQVACRLEVGGEIEGQTQYIDRQSTPASVLLGAETVIQGTTFTATAQSDGLGHYRFDRLPYGKYELKVLSNGLVSEPKTGVLVERGKPTRNVTVDVYEACTVKGRVVDGRNNGPVAGASVTMEAVYGPNASRKKTFQTRSDQHGGFAFFRVPGGAHVARASASGFLKTVTDASEARFSLQPGERKADVALTLDRGGIVEGFVVDENDRPIEDADVQIFSPSDIYMKIDDRAFKGTTDGAGYFMISGIPLGEHIQLYASAIKAGYAKGRSLIIDLTIRDPEAITEITLKPGGSVTGKITDRNNLPVRGAVIQLDSQEFPGDPSPSGMTTRSGRDGSYALPFVPPGLARMSVSRSGFVKQDRNVTVKDKQPTANVNFKLEPGVEIAGTVAALDGKPVAAAQVVARAATRSTKGTDSTVSDREGKFTLSNLGEGLFRLEARFKLPTSDGEQSYLFLNPAVPSGSQDAAIDCDVGNLLTGLVVDENGKGINNFTLSLRSRDDVVQNFTFDLDRKLTNSRGSFMVQKIPRGIYNVSITAEGYEPYLEDNLAVGPTPRTDLPRIELRAAGGVTGELVSSSTNRPVNGVRVRLLDPDAPNLQTARELAPTAVSDAQGIFRITTAVAGRYDVEFTHASYLPDKVNGVSVDARKLTDLGRLYLEAGGGVRGTVTDGEGNPVRGIRMRISALSKDVLTDAAGNYLFQGVQEGRWTVTARGRVGERTVYSAQPVVVQPDETEQVDFVLATDGELEGLVAVSGAEGVVKTGTVRIHPLDETGLVMEDIHYDANVSRSDGTFSIRQVPPGMYFLWVSGNGPTNAPYTAWKLINLSRGSNESIVAVGSAALKGLVREASTGKVAKRVAIQMRPLFDSLRLPPGIYDDLCRSTTTNNNGRYAFTQLQPGPWQLLYQPAQGGWYAQAPTTLSEGESVGNYDLTVP